MIKISHSVVALMLAFGTTAAFAADAPTPPAKPEAGKPMMMGGEHGPMGGHGRMFEENDANKDGSIDKSEWQAKGDKMFKEVDANGDGKVSQDEMKARHEKKREEWKERREERKERREEMKEKMGERMEHKGDKPAAAPAEAPKH